MLLRIFALSGLLLAGAAALSPAQALSMKDCSVKYHAAQQAGSLNGMSWNDFRKANCGSDASAAAAAPSPAATAPASSSAAAAAPATAPAMTSSGSVSFPRAVDPKYASESAGKARMHTCLDAYHALKASNGLNGLKWIQKGGGYYSQCNAKLKG